MGAEIWVMRNQIVVSLAGESMVADLELFQAYPSATQVFHPPNTKPRIS
jgi:hypothetical protein